MLFADLLSLHLFTFLMFFILVNRRGDHEDFNMMKECTLHEEIENENETEIS